MSYPIEVGQTMDCRSDEDVSQEGVALHDEPMKHSHHAGNPGYRPEFPRDQKHIATCTGIIKDRAYMECVCGAVWDFKR